MAFTDAIGRMDEACLRAFGRDVTYLPQSGGQTTVRAIFEATREAEENAPGVYAVMFLRAAELSTPPQRGDEVSVDGVTYKVFDIEADHGGGLVLRLRQT
jgi:hypothetical protein